VLGLPEHWYKEVDEFGQLLLHRAAELGGEEVLKYLVESLPADTNVLELRLLRTHALSKFQRRRRRFCPALRLSER
jgi:hypothetical protein